ncbi:hypothetical protein J6590_037900 [Homalodisca vitripennis]|nr:hypothetical protein J6590_037900 [Homalodisca vitripennis]
MAAEIPDRKNDGNLQTTTEVIIHKTLALTRTQHTTQQHRHTERALECDNRERRHKDGITPAPQNRLSEKCAAGEERVEVPPPHHPPLPSSCDVINTARLIT